MTTALITGITGQDGSYLTELLLARGYTVHDLIRHYHIEVRDRRMAVRSHPARAGAGSHQGG